MKLKFKINSVGCYTMLLTIVMFYFSYRYPFRWANEVTSETYTNTPAAIQISKYAICILLIGISVIFQFVNRKGVRLHIKPEILSLIIFAFFQSFYAFAVVRDQNTLILHIGMGIILGMCLTAKESINFYFLDRLFIFFINFNIIYEIVQISLYVTQGRLPAIAWSNAGLMQVRFGGGFDDPFALSLFMGFLIPYAYHRFSGMRRIFYVSILAIMLVLTWTLTSLFTLMGIYILDRGYALAKGRGWNNRRILLIILLLIVGTVLAVIYGEHFIGRIVAVKGMSIKGHIESASLEGLSVRAFSGIRPEAHYSESSPSRMLFTDGVFFTLAFYLLGMYSVRRLMLTIRNLPQNLIKYKPVLLGMVYYQLCFLLGSVNLPFPYMFFNLIAFSVFTGMSFVINTTNDIQLT